MVISPINKLATLYDRRVSIRNALALLPLLTDEKAAAAQVIKLLEKFAERS